MGVDYDNSRIHLVLTNGDIATHPFSLLLQQDFGDEPLHIGSRCLYMYLPRKSEKKRLNANFLEKKLGITATMRKLRIIS
ncbi:hypothetical protein E4T83_06195 [Streptococcus sp. AN2]|nr:hypothetical protein E4T83_06195 [Streptococcus sp. AN2]